MFLPKYVNPCGPDMLSPPPRAYFVRIKTTTKCQKLCYSYTPIGYDLFIFRHNSK